jgi:hypothetical protein
VKAGCRRWALRKLYARVASTLDLTSKAAPSEPGTHASDPGDGDVRDTVPGPTYLHAWAADTSGACSFVISARTWTTRQRTSHRGRRPWSRTRAVTSRLDGCSPVSLGARLDGPRPARHPSARPKRPLPGGTVLVDGDQMRQRRGLNHCLARGVEHGWQSVLRPTRAGSCPCRSCPFRSCVRHSCSC